MFTNVLPCASYNNKHHTLMYMYVTCMQWRLWTTPCVVTINKGCDRMHLVSIPILLSSRNIQHPGTAVKPSQNRWRHKKDVFFWMQPSPCRDGVFWAWLLTTFVQWCVCIGIVDSGQVDAYRVCWWSAGRGLCLHPRNTATGDLQKWLQENEQYLAMKLDLGNQF